MSELKEHSCCADAAYLWYDDGKWIFDMDNGMKGPIIKFCPFCGEKLPL